MTNDSQKREELVEYFLGMDLEVLNEVTEPRFATAIRREVLDNGLEQG